MLPEAYIQSLLAAALDCVDCPTPEQPQAGAPAASAGQRPTGGSDGGGGAPAATTAVDNATLAALLLEDEPDSATAAEAGRASAGAGALALTLGLAGGGAADELAAAQRAGSPPPDLGDMLALPLPPPPALPPGVAAAGGSEVPPGLAATGGPELPPAPPLAAAGGVAGSPASLPAPAPAAVPRQAGSPAADAPQAPSPGTGEPAGTGPREPGAPAARPGTCRAFARRAAALYAAYALLEAQPRTGLHAEHPRVLLYLPPSRVRSLGGLAAAAAAAGVRDVAAIVRRLVRARAFVVGAVRRPPCGAPPPVAQAEQLAGCGAPGAVCMCGIRWSADACWLPGGARPPASYGGAVGLVWRLFVHFFFLFVIPPAAEVVVSTVSHVVRPTAAGCAGACLLHGGAAVPGHGGGSGDASCTWQGYRSCGAAA
jgi:hypothetical protein